MESTTVKHPDGTTITTTTEGLITTTVVTHPDGTELTASTEQAGDGKPKERVLLPTTVTPSHYDVHLTPWQAGKGEQQGFTGEATVTITVNEPTETITLHALELDILTAAVNEDHTVEDGISYDSKLQTATLTFASPLPTGEAKLVMSFIGVLNDKMCGFYNSTYTEDGEKKQMATTQFEATDARRAFPCWDEPSLKATFSFTLTVPAGMTAVSNMPIVSTEAASELDGWKTVVFEESCIMSTYLGAFVVAEMGFIEGATKRRGIPCRVYATSGKEKQGQFALEVCEKVLDFFEEYFGIDYPLPKMDMLAIPDFAAGAMENYGCVTYRETAILWDPEKSAASAKQRVAEVVAHELAHQWFGNLTTMQWWDNLWLNEGFATFIGTMAVDHLFPEWVVWTQFVKDDWAGAMSLDGMASSHPIQVEVFSADEVSEIFDAISYYKGASVIRQVFDWIGPEAFRTGLQAYLTKFQYKNTLTDDLWAAWAEASGKPVGDVMAGWTLQTGYPLLTVSQHGDDQLSITQDRFLSDGSAGEGEWKMPIAVCGDKDGSKAYFLLEAKEAMMPMPSAYGVLSSWVKVNPAQTGVYRVRYSPELLSKLVPAVKDLSPSDRIGLVDDAFALATAGKTETTDVLSFLLAFTEETDYTVWSKISAGIGTIKVLLAGNAEAYGYLKSFIRKLYGPICASVGWEKKEGEAHTDSLKRALVLKAISAADDEATKKVAAEKFELLKADPNAAVDPDLKLLVYSLAAANGGEEAFDTLVALMRDPDTMSEERVRLLQSLGSTKDTTIMEKILRMLLDEESGVRSQDAMYCMAGVSMNLVYGRAFAWSWFKENWDALFDKFGTGGSFTLPRLVSYATKCLVRSEDADDVEQFFETHECEGAARTVQQAVESIRTAAASNAREGEKIVAWLKQNAAA